MGIIGRIQPWQDRLQDLNEGIKRIFDQGLNAAISGGINIKAYEMLVKYAPNVRGSKWMNYEEFIAQAISDILGEILSFYYLVPLFGLNKTNIMTVMVKLIELPFFIE